MGQSFSGYAHAHRHASLELPERFRVRDDEEDVTGVDENRIGNVQQSLYGLIGAGSGGGAKSTLHLPALFQEDEGSDSGGDAETDCEAAKAVGGAASTPMPSEGERQETKDPRDLRTCLQSRRERAAEPTDPDEALSQSQILAPVSHHIQEPARPASAAGSRDKAPTLDRRLSAAAKARTRTDVNAPTAAAASTSPSCAARQRRADRNQTIAQIFHLDQPEDVLGEYTCWYLQSAMLRGWLYLTPKHVLFFSYLQKTTGKTIKSSYLSKQGKRNPRFKRYWFALKGDVLTYYATAADPYSPSGSINLLYATSAALKEKEGAAEATGFTITTREQIYSFRADSAASAREWVTQLQKVIFRARNDSDAVKLCLRVEDVVDVESTSVTDLAKTIRLRVINKGETFAVEEYFFDFFEKGAEVMEKLGELTRESIVRRWEGERRRAVETPDQSRVSIEGPVRPPPGSMSSHPQAPKEGSRHRSAHRSHRRPSGERGRRSVSGGGSQSNGHKGRRASTSPSVQASTDSVNSTTSEFSPSSPETVPADMTASTMLLGDGAFRAPTLQQARSAVPGTKVEKLRRESLEIPPASPAAAPRTQPTAADGCRTRPAASTTRQRRTILATPLQYAYGLAEQVRTQTSRGLSYLGSSPKEYYGRFSDALAGGKIQYAEPDVIDDPAAAAEDNLMMEGSVVDAEAEKRFQDHFGLPRTEKLLAAFYCSLHRVLPLYGKVYIGTRHFCFRSLLYGTRTKLLVPFRSVLNVEKEKGYRWGYPGMVVVIRGREEIFFDFKNCGLRDECVVTVLKRLVESQSAHSVSVVLTPDERVDAAVAREEERALREGRDEGEGAGSRDEDEEGEEGDEEGGGEVSIVFDDINASVLDFKPKTSLRITCLTIGSRGDVQPYIALCKGLQAEGHRARIATHAEFQSWIESHGIAFAPVNGDPAELMRVCVENGMFTPSFIYKVNSQFRDWLDGLLTSAYVACQGSDLLLESPSAMCGIHIAEALEIPYFRAFTMPWTRTRAYPHAFAVPNSKMGGNYNIRSYDLFENLIWVMTARQINRWRRTQLGLPPTTLGRLQVNKVPFLYNFSPSVVVPPLDFSDWVRVTGYWFLNEGATYRPPARLAAFIAKARADGQKLVYIGFGSVVVNDARQLLQQIIAAVRKADVRCVLSKGWSDRLDPALAARPPIALPPSILHAEGTPHDWLFAQMDAVVHHGGAGTTGASVRAGIPTIIKPFFGDQFFFATRVEDLGVGLWLERITGNELGKALWIATHDERMRRKAGRLGEVVRAEDGVGTAIKALYRDLEYARSLVKRRGAVGVGGAGRGEEAEVEEESWTFVENDSDVEVAGRMSGESEARQQKNGMGSPRLGLGSLLPARTGSRAS